MQAVYSPNSDSHVRQLLDDRTARADPLGRYPAYEDSPSVYSRAFSPTFRHRPLLDDPSSSILDLDLDEDARSSMALEHDPHDDSDGDSLTRVSYLGPKMRFHSRAPWELEGETLQEVDETESNGHGSLIGIFTGARAKAHKTGSSSSPRLSTTTGRPSVESSRSFLNSKRSFDTSTSATHPRGALYALAQESLSTSSLGRPHHSGRQDGPGGNFSLGRLRSHSSNVDIPSPSDGSLVRLPSNNHPLNAPPSPRASCDTTSSTLDIQAGLNARFTGRRPHKGIHPYANPDLVVSYSTDPPSPKSPIPPNLPYTEVLRKDSNTTMVEISALSASAKSLLKSASTTGTLTAPKRRVSHIQGKDISSPVNFLPPDSPILPQSDEPSPLPAGVGAFSGWTDRNVNPGFSLISLEEARAQRTRGATLPVQLQSHESSSSGDSSATTAPQNSTHETSTTPAGSFSEANRPDFVAARSRARSISAGVKAKNALSSFVKQPERRGSENGLVAGSQTTGVKDANATASGKGLKHKKSGFMRLFGNGKGNEKEPLPVPQPPSVPPLPQSEASAPPFIPRHNPKLSSHRIPVPSLSPSLLEAITQEGQYHLGDSPFDSQKALRSPTVSPKRPPPHPLSISTGYSSRGPLLSAFDDTNIPQSAPPNVGDYPTLKLRPVSTLFSTHFGDHIDVTKLKFDDSDSIVPKETQEELTRREQNDRHRQDSLASGSVSSGPSSASAPSFVDSQYNLSPIAPSYAGTTLTTPTTGGLMSPTSTTGPWSRGERDYYNHGGGRISTDQQSVPPSSLSNMNVSSLGAMHHVVVKGHDGKDVEVTTTIKVLQEHLHNTNKMWQKRVWDLENEIRALKNELEESKLSKIDSRGRCDNCGTDLASAGGAREGGAGEVMGGGSGVSSVPPLLSKEQQRPKLLKPDGGVMNRPRARTGGSTRFVNCQL